MKKVFRYNGKDIVEQLAQTIKQIGGDNPVYFCVGSDLAVADSLGPKVGTRLKERSNGSVIVYGVEGNTINAKNVQKAYRAVRWLHPQSTIIAIDASKDKRRGTIRVKNCGIRPGAGAGKNLGSVGNKGIMCCTILHNYIFTKEDYDFGLVATRAVSSTANRLRD